MRRGKRQRRESQRYSGFVVGIRHPTTDLEIISEDELQLPDPENTTLHSFLTEVADRSFNVHSKSDKTLPLSQERETMYIAPLVSGTSTLGTDNLGSSIVGPSTQHKEASEKGSCQLKSKSDHNLIRKHAICAIFDKIWTPKKSAVLRKPYKSIINGFEDDVNDEAKLSSTSEIVSIDNSPIKCSESSCQSPSILSPAEDGFLPHSAWLHRAQNLCANKLHRTKLQLTVKKVEIVKSRGIQIKSSNTHRKRRRRKKWGRARIRRPHHNDADDEDSDGNINEIKPTAPLFGPLKDLALPDLWMQKEFYLRHLCNFYQMSSQGSKVLLISRLHQFILQSTGSASLSKPKMVMQRPIFCRSKFDRSWVVLNVKYKSTYANQ